MRMGARRASRPAPGGESQRVGLVAQDRKKARARQRWCAFDFPAARAWVAAATANHSPRARLCRRPRRAKEPRSRARASSGAASAAPTRPGKNRKPWIIPARRETVVGTPAFRSHAAHASPSSRKGSYSAVWTSARRRPSWPRRVETINRARAVRPGASSPRPARFGARGLLAEPQQRRASGQVQKRRADPAEGNSRTGIRLSPRSPLSGFSPPAMHGRNRRVA